MLRNVSYIFVLLAALQAEGHEIIEMKLFPPIRAWMDLGTNANNAKPIESDCGMQTMKHRPWMSSGSAGEVPLWTSGRSGLHQLLGQCFHGMTQFKANAVLHASGSGLCSFVLIGSRPAGLADLR